MRRFASGMAACLLGFGMSAASAATAPGPAGAASGIQRIISLDELGYSNGIQFSGLFGKAELYFPVPEKPWIRSLRLRLPYSAQSAFDRQRAIELVIGGKVLFLSPLVKDSGNGVIDVPVPTEAATGGFVHATLNYRGVTLDKDGARAGDRCLDHWWAGDNLYLDPAGALVMDGSADAPLTISAAVALMPRDVTVQLSPNASEAQAAAALTLISGNSHGSLSFGPPQGGDSGARGLIVIAGPEAPAIQALVRNGVPEIILGGRDPAAGARAITSSWRPVLALPQVARISTPTNSSSNQLRIADLDGYMHSADIGDVGGWTIALPMSRVPAGLTVRALAIDVALADDVAAPRAVVSAWLNGTMLGSARADAALGAPTRLRLDVPRGLLQAHNTIEVRVARARRLDCGDWPVTYPAQLLESSEVVLGPASKPAEFFEFAPLFHSGVTVVVPGPAALPLAAKAISGLAGRDAVIAVSYAKTPAGGPVVLVSDRPPAGSRPRLNVEPGGVTLSDSDGRPLLNTTGLEDLPTAQLLEADGRPVLWLRPGTAMKAPSELWLDRGDVAFIGAVGVLLAVDSAHYPSSGGRTDARAVGLFGIPLSWLVAAGILALLVLAFFGVRHLLDRRGG